MSDEIPSDFLKSGQLDSAIRQLAGDLVGRRIGVHEVVSLLDTGGMGEVYRARDTKLGREVAIKVLPPELAADRERLARFEREARVLASLNHPHIGAIYGVEELSGAPALVLELVDGETLAERLSRGPLPVPEALTYARQIAEALDVAHERGIIHRDLKPANVMITPAGAVKVLDFGLAKIAGPLDGEPSRDGMVVGTASYMSPEQAHGHAVDKRTDIWAFGCVVFEMLTGTRAFPEPHWNALPARTPARVQTLLRRCLEHDPTHRLRDIGDAALELTERESIEAPPPRPWSSYAPWALAALLAAGIAAILATYPERGPQPPLPIARVSMPTEPLAVLNHAPSAVVALSPDGTHVVYAAGPPSRLYVRRLDSLEATPISGGDVAHSPFFSPDGLSIGFVSGGELKTMPIGGGASTVICKVSDVVHGASWGPDRRILFSDAAAIWRVSDDGAKPELVVDFGLWPEALPGGAGFVFTDMRGATPGIWVHSWKTGERRVLLDVGSHARYAASGHLVYASNGSLFAAPFDVERLELTGPAVPVLTGAMMGLPQERELAHFALSATGTLAYLPGPVLGPGRTLVWVDHQQREEPLPLEPRHYESPRVSPDGNRIVVEILEKPGGWNIWTYDIARRSLRPLTSHPLDDKFPLWSRDGQRIIFSSSRDNGGWNLYPRPRMEPVSLSA